MQNLLPGESNRVQDLENTNIFYVDRIKGSQFQHVKENRSTTGEETNPADETQTIETITIIRTITAVTTY